MGIGNLGLAEILIISLFVLVFFGPGRLPEIARSMGRALREFRRGMNEIKREFEDVERSSREAGRSREERPAGQLRPPDAEPGEDAGSGDAGPEGSDGRGDADAPPDNLP